MTDPGLPEATDARLLRLSPKDNVCVAAGTIEAGEQVTIDAASVTVAQRVPLGHKLAAAPIAAGEKVVKYGAPIGSASRDIHVGQHVHTHNLKSDYLPTYTLEDPPPP